jgi:hypothetical protein
MFHKRSEFGQWQGCRVCRGEAIYLACCRAREQESVDSGSCQDMACSLAPDAPRSLALRGRCAAATAWEKREKGLWIEELEEAVSDD